MSSSKVFIAAFFLIVVLFVVGINLGALHSDDRTFQKPAWLSGIGGILVSQQPLKLADLDPMPANCLARGSIDVASGSSCTFAIRQSSFTLRIVTLQLVQGNSAMVTLSQEEMLPVQQSLKAHATTNADLKVYPGKAHGMLLVKCLDGGNVAPCLLALK